MNDKAIAAALAEVSDICAAAAGDMHTLHLNMHGIEFDTFHKKVLQKYYEQLDDDYDSLAEFAGCYSWECKNKNESASRVKWTSYSGSCDRIEAVNVTNEVLAVVLKNLKDLYVVLNKLSDNPLAIGITNWLQGRIEYWAKEVYYFNARRVK
jgi:DNA-binding ferritin-like protein